MQLQLCEQGRMNLLTKSMPHFYISARVFPPQVEKPPGAHYGLIAPEAPADRLQLLYVIFLTV